MREDWLICMMIYLEIAETYLLFPTKNNIDQAKQKYKKAFELQSTFGGILLTTQYHFNLYQQYIHFCLKFGNLEDLNDARKISVEMRERCVQQKRKQAIGDNLIKIEDRTKSKVSLVINECYLCIIYRKVKVCIYKRGNAKPKRKQKTTRLITNAP